MIQKSDLDDFADVEEDEDEADLDEDEDWLHTSHMPVARRTYRPYRKEYIDAMKKARLKEVKLQAIMNELVTFAGFIFILFVLSYGNKDPNSFLLKDQMMETFVVKNGFNDSMHTADDWWRWANATMPNVTKAQILYNGKPPYGYRGYLGDKTQRMMGYATLRQVRVKKNSCQVAPSVENLTRECAPHAQLIYEDKEDYCNKWEEKTPLTENLPSCSMAEFRYTTAKALNSMPIHADFDTYGGGGYVFKVKGLNKDISAKLLKLQQQRWINAQTRAILLEFSVYNPNVNLFVVASIIAEFLPGGGIHTYARFDPVKLITIMSVGGIFTYVCKLLFLVLVSYFTLRELRLMVLQKWEYWKSYWAYAQWSILAAAYSAIALHVYKDYLTAELLKIFRKTKGNGYMKFQRVTLVDELYGYMLGLMIFVGTLMILKILRFNNRMAMLIKTLSTCWSDLSGFLAVFYLVFFAFVQMFHIILYTDMHDFMTVRWTLETCFTMMLNRFKFGTLKETSEVAAFMFFFFAVSCSWILVNVLLTIIIEGFEKVKCELEGKKNELEVIEYCWGVLRSMGGLQKKPTFIHEYANVKQKPDIVVEVSEDDEEDNDMETYEELPQKIDMFLQYVNRMYFDDSLDLGGKDKMKSFFNKEPFNLKKSNDNQEMSNDNEESSNKKKPADSQSNAALNDEEFINSLLNDDIELNNAKNTDFDDFDF